MSTPSHHYPLLSRHDALEQCFYLDKSHFRILAIHAQAGAGKTVLVTQYEQSSDTPFAWTTCSLRHADPHIIFEEIVSSLDNAHPLFSGDEILETLQQQLTPQEFIDIAARILGEALEGIPGPINVVIDDAHLLHGHEHSLQLIQQLHCASPPNFQIILVSRFPLLLDEKPLFESNQQLVIDESILALSREEIAILYNEVLNTPVDIERVNKLHEVTQGWVAGLVLLRNARTLEETGMANKTEAVGRYFDELTSSLEDKTKRELMLVAQLTEIPEAILNKLCSRELHDWLGATASRHLFIRSNVKQGTTTFRLHHLFQAHLIHEAEATFSPRETSAFLKESGETLLSLGDLDSGLHYLVSANAWDEIAKAMQVHGLTMVGQNHHQTLLTILDSVPTGVRNAHGWLTFVYGTVLLNLQPEKSYDNLLLAAKLFKDKEDLIGELLATACLINFTVIISGIFGKKAHLVQRAVELFESLKEQLPPALVELAAQAIALGYAYCETKTREAAQYAEMTISQKDPSESMTANPWLLYAKLVVSALEGDVHGSLDQISPFFPPANDTMCSPTTRYSLEVIHANYLLMSGDIFGYKVSRKAISRKWSAFMQNAYTSVFFTVWDLDVLIAEGRYQAAYDLAKQYDRSNPDLIPHMRSQILHYQMLAAAFLGQQDKAMRLMRTALRQRTQGGGPYFVHLTHSLTGAALSVLGKTHTAERIFNKCLEFSEARLVYHGHLAYGYRAAMNIRLGRLEEAKADIEAMLHRMQRFNNSHFFGWSPDVMIPVLCTAVREAINPAYARKLANRQLRLDILDDGTPIPLLQIECTSTLTLSLNDKQLSDEDLSPMWQQLFRLLAESPNQMFNVELIQDLLWPESPPEKTRSKFDTMLSRLRNKIGATFGAESKLRYLQLQGQKLYLKHCSVDRDHIIENAKAGMELADREKHWQAHDAFVLMRHWLGKTYDNPQRWCARQDSKDLVIRALTRWTSLLMEANAPDEALEVVEKAIAFDPINDTAQRQRYTLLTSLKRPGEAQQSLKRYRQALAEEGFEKQEISHIIENIFSI